MGPALREARSVRCNKGGLLWETASPGEGARSCRRLLEGCGPCVEPKGHVGAEQEGDMKVDIECVPRSG